MVRAAEADVGGQEVTSIDLLGWAALGREDQYRAAARRGAADTSGTVHRQAVEILARAGPADDGATVRGVRACLACKAGRGELVGKQMCLIGQSNVERASIRRQANAVCPIEWPGNHPDVRAIGSGIIKASAHPSWTAIPAEIGEPETTVRVEHDVIGPPEGVVLPEAYKMSNAPLIGSTTWIMPGGVSRGASNGRSLPSGKII